MNYNMNYNTKLVIRVIRVIKTNRIKIFCILYLILCVSWSLLALYIYFIKEDNNLDWFIISITSLVTLKGIMVSYFFYPKDNTNSLPVKEIDMSELTEADYYNGDESDNFAQ